MHCPICNNHLKGNGYCTSNNSHFFFSEKYFVPANRGTSFVVGLNGGESVLSYVSNSNDSYIDDQYKRIACVDFLPESKENIIKAFELLKKYKRLQAFA
jgi:hypothetical protein